MKKFLILLLFPLITYGQGESGYIDKCYIDAKTKDTVIETFWKHLYYETSNLMNFRITKLNSICTLELKYHFGNSGAFTVQKGDSIWIKFEGGYTMTVYANQTVQATIGGSAAEGCGAGGSASYGVNVGFGLSNNQLLALAGNQIEKIRVFSTTGKTDLEIEHQYSNKVMTEAGMILKKRKIKVKDKDQEGKVDTW